MNSIQPLPAAQQVDLPGVRLAYREWGDPASPTVILLHALGLDSANWENVAPELSTTRRVLALDFRGFGDSGRPGAYSLELMRDDVLSFAAALGIERFSLIGHSMGGAVAYLVAEKMAERIERLVLEDTPPPYQSGMPEPPTEPPDPAPPFDWAALHAIVRVFNRPPDPSWWDDLFRITCPTLVIDGDSGRFPEGMLTRVADTIPGARLVTIEGGTHHVHSTKPAEFLAVTRAFLAEAEQ